MKTDIFKNITSMLGRTGLKLEKHAPEICVGAGLVLGAATTVLACKATIKAAEVVEKHKEQTELIREGIENPDIPESEYSKKDAQKDLIITYRNSAVKLVKLYGPSVVLGVASAGLILKGNHILRGRNVALAAAYATVDKGFKRYRNRVVDRFGETVDRELKHNIRSEKVTETEVDEKTGKEKKVKKTVDICDDPDIYSDYARFFDDSSRHWEKDSEYNLMFLRAQQQYANDLLVSRGHLFLNEVYDMLDIPRTKAGQVVGWVYDTDNPIGDNYVDFGIYNTKREVVRDFVNGRENVILLDFNVDGAVLDLI